MGSFSLLVTHAKGPWKSPLTSISPVSSSRCEMRGGARLHPALKVSDPVYKAKFSSRASLKMIFKIIVQ